MDKAQDFCEDCGRTDLHLVEGLCAACKANYDEIAEHDINQGEHACNDVPIINMNTARQLYQIDAWRESLGVEVVA